MLKITGIHKGIVIDHIKVGLGSKIFNELNLDKVPYPTALIRNVSSNKLGKKDLIKIDNVIDLDLNILGLIDPNLTITIIENDTITQKNKIKLPKQVTGILCCKNPRCITALETQIDTTFHLVDSTKKEYRCEYCNTRTHL